MLQFEQYSKYTFKKELKKKIIERNRSNMISMCEKKKYSKVDLESIKNAPFQVSNYFKELNVDDSRLRFKVLSRMTPSVASNYSRKFREKGLLCVGCVSPPLLPPPSVHTATSSAASVPQN